MVANGQHLRHQPVPVVLHRTAQRFEFGRHGLVGGHDVAKTSQAGDLAGGVGKRRGGGLRGAEHGPFASCQNRLSSQIVDASERRQAGRRY